MSRNHHPQKSSRPDRGRRTVLALGAMGAMLAVGACSAPGSASTDAPSAPTAVSTDITTPVTITLYDGAGLKAIDDALIAAFTKKNPNVKVETRFDPDNVQAQNAPRVLASDNPPDVARIVALGDIVGNKLLTPLTPWSAAYGWDLPAGQMAMYTVDDQGVRGSGTQYTLASGFVTTGVYYNKALAKKVGMTAPPATVDEFAGLLAKAKSAGITPIIAGNSTGQGVFISQMLINDHMGAKPVNEWVFDAPGATIDTPEALQGVTTADEWIKAGYFNSDANGTDNAGAAGRFAKGEALFYPSGNWDATTLSSQMGDNVGFFAPPGLTAGKVLAMSDPVSNFGIPAKAANKDAAAAFLNFLLSEEARNIMVENGFAPSGQGPAPTTKPGSLNEAIQSSFADLVAADGQVQFVQNATNGSSQAWSEQSQLLFGGKTTPADYLKAIQSNYEEELKR
jgi:raffinose/stachyose/melibiose transport system substrate-binding protein